jgi:hypothetical protein
MLPQPTSGSTPRPPTTSTGPPTPSIDPSAYILSLMPYDGGLLTSSPPFPAKLGLLPKKPVSLLRDPASQPQRRPTEDEDDMYASPEEQTASSAKPPAHDSGYL